MRKTILLVLMFTLFLIYAPAKLMGQDGSIASVELTMTPFTESEVWISPGYLKGRVFLSEFGVPVGIRVGLGVDMLISEDQQDDPETVRTISRYNIRPGVEYYIYSGSDARAFAGVDFVFDRRDTNIDAGHGVPVSGAWDPDDLFNMRGYTAYGFNVVAGGDYYLEGGGFFIGTEIGFQFLYTTHHEVKVGHNEIPVIPQTISNQFMPTLRSVIRVGIAF